MAPSALECTAGNVYTGESLQGLKRKDLLILCKKHDIKCVGKNTELIEKLLALRQSKEGSNSEEIETIEMAADGILNENATEAARVSSMMSVHQETSPAVDEDEAQALPEVSVNEEINHYQPSPKVAKVELKSVEYKPSPKLVKSQEIAPATETIAPDKSPRRASAPNPVSSVGNNRFTVPPPSMTKVKSNSAPHIRPLTKTQTNPVAAAQAKKKFDLKESLKRPLTYKPYTGPLKPFNQNANNNNNNNNKKY